MEFLYLFYNPNRKTGFIGFIICLNSILELYKTLIETDQLEHIKIYKLSQDHLEHFFGSIRFGPMVGIMITLQLDSFVLSIEN